MAVDCQVVAHAGQPRHADDGGDIGEQDGAGDHRPGQGGPPPQSPVLVPEPQRVILVNIQARRCGELSWTYPESAQGGRSWSRNCENRARRGRPRCRALTFTRNHIVATTYAALVHAPRDTFAHTHVSFG